MRTKFIACGFQEKELKRTIKQVPKMDRNELLKDQQSQQILLISTWDPIYPYNFTLSHILKNKFHLIHLISFI